MKNIKGYCISISITLFKYRIEFDICPLVFNRLLFVVPENDRRFYSPHFLFGPLHIWTMKTDHLLGIELDASYNYFWYDKPTVPSGYKIILGSRHATL